jgi:hypothetical protein
VFVDHPEHFANGNDLPGLFHHLLQHPILLGGDLNIYLVSFQFHQGVSLPDSIALVLEPRGNRGINDGFAQYWDTNFNGHNLLHAGPAACWTLL